MIHNNCLSNKKFLVLQILPWNYLSRKFPESQASPIINGASLRFTPRDHRHILLPSCRYPWQSSSQSTIYFFLVLKGYRSASKDFSATMSVRRTRNEIILLLCP